MVTGNCSWVIKALCHNYMDGQHHRPATLKQSASQLHGEEGPVCLCVCMTNCTVFACMCVHGHRGSTPPCDRSAVVKPPVFKPYTGSLSPYTHTHTHTHNFNPHSSPHPQPIIPHQWSDSCRECV